jgi:uncharacterized protein with NRDE domain
LTGAQSPKDYLSQVACRARDYAGFNLLVGNESSLWYFTNSGTRAPHQLAPGIYGLSNASLDTPWPKVKMGKARLARLLEDPPMTHDKLARIVSDRQLADQRDLSALNLDSPMEPVLSAQFIVTETYGTRSSTTLWIDNHRRVSWREQSFDAQGSLSSLQQWDFQYR